MWETWVQSLGSEDPLEEGMAIHSSIFAWKISMNRTTKYLHTMLLFRNAFLMLKSQMIIMLPQTHFLKCELYHIYLALTFKFCFISTSICGGLKHFLLMHRNAEELMLSVSLNIS